jgi:hypothetical protein
MAFDNSFTAVTGATLAAADWNTSVKGNFTASWVGTTAGDMEYYSSATAKTRVAKGTAKQVWTMNSGATAPEWANIFPVGSVYISVVSTNPSSFFGGTWVAFGTGRTLVGIDAGQTEFDTVEETGGAKTHTLTTGEIPAHSHSISSFPVWGTTGTFGSNDYIINATETKNTNNAGGGGSHNNLQPYIVVYMWKRTA